VRRGSHEDRRRQAEQRDRDEVADEEERLVEREGERGEEDSQEDVVMPACAYFVQISTTFLSLRRKPPPLSRFMFA
jgi:hypothetical protein